MTKTCNKCGVEKPISEFGNDSSRPNGKTSSCRVCRRTVNRLWYSNTKDTRRSYVRTWATENTRLWRELLYKDISCLICGTKKNIEWHHRDPTRKVFTISNIFKQSFNQSKNRDIVLKEIEKCDPICRTCHRQVHQKIVQQYYPIVLKEMITEKNNLAIFAMVES